MIVPRSQYMLIPYEATEKKERLFFYDAQKRPVFVEYGGNMYRCVHNLQRDIVAIVDSAGNPLVEYKYDAWGNLGNLALYGGDAAMDCMLSTVSYHYTDGIGGGGDNLAKILIQGGIDSNTDVFQTVAYYKPLADKQQSLNAKSYTYANGNWS